MLTRWAKPDSELLLLLMQLCLNRLGKTSSLRTQVPQQMKFWPKFWPVEPKNGSILCLWVLLDYKIELDHRLQVPSSTVVQLE